APGPPRGRCRRGAARGPHAEVERRHVRGHRVLGALPRARAAGAGRRSHRRVCTRRSDRERVRGRRRGAATKSAAAGRLLVVDDNRVNRLLLGRGLEEQGHSVQFAEHGREALDLLRGSQFDLMLLAVLMPEVDGYQVLAEMKDDPHLRDLPVIMTTALDELESAGQSIEMCDEEYRT